MKSRLFRVLSKTSDFLESTKGGVTVPTVALTGVAAAYMSSKDNKQADNSSNARLRMYEGFPYPAYYYKDTLKPQSSMTNESEGAKNKM